MVDESTGMAVVNYLRSLGYDVLAVAETISQAADSDVLARASSEGRILVTNDKDFGELAFRVGQVHQGVLLLRLQDESPTNACVYSRLFLSNMLLVCQVTSPLPQRAAYVSGRPVRYHNICRGKFFLH